MVGALSSGSTIPVAQSVTSVNRIPQISNASTAPAITTLKDDGYLFRTTPSDAFQGVALSQIARKQGVESVAVLYVNNDYGQGLADAFGAAFTARRQGDRFGRLRAGPSLLSRGIVKLAGGKAQALVLIAYPDDGGITIMRQSLEEGFFERFILTDGMKSEANDQATRRAISGGIFSARRRAAWTARRPSGSGRPIASSTARCHRTRISTAPMTRR